MKGLPVWMLGGIAILGGLLIGFGWDDRDAAGYLPFILGIIFVLFVLVSAGAQARSEEI